MAHTDGIAAGANVDAILARRFWPTEKTTELLSGEVESEETNEERT
jgi:hypothetical protein